MVKYENRLCRNLFMGFPVFNEMIVDVCTVQSKMQLYNPALALAARPRKAFLIILTNISNLPNISANCQNRPAGIMDKTFWILIRSVNDRSGIVHTDTLSTSNRPFLCNILSYVRHSKVIEYYFQKYI